MIIIPAVLLISVVGYGQVKEQFRDSENSSTIVVIKEDTAIDESVLSEYFDLDNMNMNDQIMITTKPAEVEPVETPEPLDPETATASVGNDIETFFDNIDDEETQAESSAEVENTAEVNATEIASTDNKVNKVETTPIVNTTVKKAPRRAKKSYKKKSSKRVRKAANKTYYGKKKRKKNKHKRKRPKKRKGSRGCYAF